MNGTWQTTGGGGLGIRLVAVAAAAAAVVSYLATVLLILAIIAGVLLVVLVVGVLLLRRHLNNPADVVELGRQGAELRAYSERQALEARPATVIHYHGGTHLHVEPGAVPGGVTWPMLPLRDVVGEIKED
jgi:hypothetical protein